MVTIDHRFQWIYYVYPNKNVQYVPTHLIVYLLSWIQNQEKNYM